MRPEHVSGVVRALIKLPDAIKIIPHATQSLQGKRIFGLLTGYQHPPLSIQNSNFSKGFSTCHKVLP